MRLEKITQHDITSLKDVELHDLWHRASQLWSRYCSKGVGRADITKNTLFDAAWTIQFEMKRRKISPISSRLSLAVFKHRMKKRLLEQSSDLPEEVVIQKSAAVVFGSAGSREVVVQKCGNEGKYLSILLLRSGIRGKARNIQEGSLSKSLRGVTYDLVLRRR